jgi:hypothetical protein
MATLDLAGHRLVRRLGRNGEAGLGTHLLARWLRLVTLN